MNTQIKYVIYWTLLSILLLTACQQQGSRQLIYSKAGNNIAEQFLEAYNNHDQQHMLSLVHPEIKYMYVDSDQVYTETNSKQKLADFLIVFFDNKPAAESRLLSSQQQGSFIHQVEQALWTDKVGKQKSQCSLSVYEIKDELILNVWYFTTFECPLP